MSSSNIERKLAAIMFTDIAGYTALSAKNETKALKLLDTQKQILTPIIEEFNGTLHKEIGDGLLFTFPTVTEAVRCGIKIQEKTKANDDLNLRIGIHEGEITLKDGDALGDDVNVASRIEAFAPSGGIAISSKVQQNISSLPEFETSYICKPELKGVVQNVEIFCISSHGLPKAKDSQSQKMNSVKRWSLAKKILFPLTGLILTLIGAIFWFIFPFLAIGIGDEKAYDASIAILYMDHMGKEDNSYLADGLTEELINRLSRIHNIKVRPKTDVAAYRNRMPTTSEIANQLKVNYIVEGSVRIFDDEIRTNVQLFDIGQDKITWSDTYENKLQNIFDLQDDIASKIVSKLDEKITISKSDIIATKRRPTENLEAYKLVSKSFDILSKGRLDFYINSTEKAIPLIKKALSLDSTYADAYAALAMANTFKYDPLFDEEKPKFIKASHDAMILIEEALFFDPDNEAGHALRIMIPFLRLIEDDDHDVNITVTDLFRFRQLAEKIDQGLEKFPDSPFFLTIAGICIYKIGDLRQDQYKVEQGLSYLLKSHSIYKKLDIQKSDFFVKFARDMNFSLIPQIISEESKRKASEFLVENRHIMCDDGTFSCINIVYLWKVLYDLNESDGPMYYSNFNDVALELLEEGISRSDERIKKDLNLIGVDYGPGSNWEKWQLCHTKIRFLQDYGDIYLQRGKFDVAIDHFTNSLQLIEKSNLEITLDPEIEEEVYDADFEGYKLMANRKIGFSYFYQGNFIKAGVYFQKGHYIPYKTEKENNIVKNKYNFAEGQEKRHEISALNYFGLSELLAGNIEKAEKAINYTELWIKINPLIKKDLIDYSGYFNIYLLYWPLYIYYDTLNQTDRAYQYLEKAYELLDKKIIEEYHKHPKKDSYAKFFYFRDIIKEYEKKSSQ